MIFRFKFSGAYGGVATSHRPLYLYGTLCCQKYLKIKLHLIKHYILQNWTKKGTIKSGESYKLSFSSI